MFHVNNNSFSLGDTSLSISFGDLTTSGNLVDSYPAILKTRETLNDAVDHAGASRTCSELKRMANTIAYILPKRIGTIIDDTSAKVADAAVVPFKPSYLGYSKNTVVDFLLGFLLSVGMFALREIFDITICSEEDVTQNCSHPILTVVPDMTAPSKGGSYYYYGYDRSKKKRAYEAASKNSEHKTAFMGPNISIATSETYTLSELNQKVILFDCDMCRPTLAEKLKFRKKPGLSSYLTGQNPPNPVELLSSDRMKRCLRILRENYTM